MAKYAQKFPHSTLSYAAFARDFIRQSVADQQPFCLSISFKASHRPVTPDPQFDEVYAETVFTKPENFGREQGRHLAPQSKTGRQYPRFEEWGYATQYDEVMRKYNQQIHAVDVAVQLIREELKTQGVDKNTVIIFTSDNGFLCGSHGYGSKVLPYEESARVPLIIYDPQHPVSGKQKRCDALTGSIDLAPTILELANVAPPAGIDGLSLVRLLDNPGSSIRDSLSIMNFWGPDTTHSFGVVTKKWKYLYWYSQENDMVPTEELFDMTGDRFESANAAMDDQNLPELNKMRERYDREVYDIKEKSINEIYRKFNVLFDRKQPWESKKQLLSDSKKKSRSPNE
jgi:arylsulfatase A-like enzyme